jgi:hypothetical protein
MSEEAIPSGTATIAATASELVAPLKTASVLTTEHVERLVTCFEKLVSLIEKAALAELSKT